MDAGIEMYLSMTDEEIRELIKPFDVDVNVGRKWVKIAIKRENNNELIKLPSDRIVNMIHVFVNGKYIGIFHGTFKFANVRALGVCKSEYGSWVLRLIV